MKKVVVVLALFLLFVTTGCFPISFKDLTREQIVERTVKFEEGVEKKVVVIPVYGIIASDNTNKGGDSITGVNRIREFLNAVEADENVVAVILEIDSPGGAAGESDAMYKLITDFKERTKLPVIAVCENLAASGGYYVACAADQIFASPMSITGSIGVIMHHIIIKGLLEDILKVEVVTIKSGEYKDIISPFRQMKEEERQYLQDLINRSYSRFKEVVSTARKMELSQVNTVADGKIYVGEQALKAGLVDKIGYLDDAVDAIKELTGHDKLNVVKYKKRVPFTSFMEVKSDNFIESYSSVLMKYSGLPMYLWKQGVK